MQKEDGPLHGVAVKDEREDEGQCAPLPPWQTRVPNVGRESHSYLSFLASHCADGCAEALSQSVHTLVFTQVPAVRLQQPTASQSPVISREQPAQPYANSTVLGLSEARPGSTLQ